MSAHNHDEEFLKKRTPTSPTQKKDVAEGIKQVLSILADSVEQDAQDLFTTVLAESGSTQERLKNVNSPDSFYFALMYPHEQFLKGVVAKKFGGDREAQWFFLHTRFVQRHYEKIIIAHEGSACSVDKSGHIIHLLAVWLLKGTEMKHDYLQEYTYHLPKDVFVDHAEILEFYKAIQNLYYGNPEQYFKVMLRYKKPENA